MNQQLKHPQQPVASMVAIETNMLLFTTFRLMSGKNSNAIECDIFNINLCEILIKNHFLCPKIQYGSLFINYCVQYKFIYAI